MNPLMLSKQVKSAVDKLVFTLKRKKFFSSTENLKKYHYDIINDMSQSHEDRNTDRKKKPNQQMNYSLRKKEGFSTINLTGYFNLIEF